MASMDAGPNADRGDMRAGTDAMAADTSAGANRADISTGMDTAAAHTSTRADNRTGMAAGMHAAIADTGARADRTDMGPGADTVAADMRPDADSQHLNPSTHVRQNRGWHEQGERKQAKCDGFHRCFFRRAMLQRAVPP
jgi:hypothetical protein